MTLLQLHQSNRTSLVRLQIINYRLVVLFMIKICTLFVCYDRIGYFSQFAYTLTHIACFHEYVNIQMVLQILWLQFIIIIIVASIRSNLTIDDNRLESKLFVESFILDSRFVRKLYSFHQTYRLDALYQSCSIQPMMLSYIASYAPDIDYLVDSLIESAIQPYIQNCLVQNQYILP